MKKTTKATKFSIAVKAIKSIILLSILAAVIAYIANGYLEASKPQPVVLQGQLEAREMNISSKISGRIGRIYITQGDKLDVGTPILIMDSPEITAKVNQAEAVRDATSAVANKAIAGARKQEIQMAYEQMQRAKAGLDVHKKTWKRIKTLAKEGLMSRQKADEAKAQYLSSQKLYKAASAQHSLAKEGARKEDIAAAKAQARQGQAVVEEAKVAESEMNLHSPVAGEVAEIFPSDGEIIAKGVPIVSVVNLQDQRLELNVREDYLKYFSLQKTFLAVVPALENREVSFTVYASAKLPDFATWRPTRTDQGFDMRTFLVKSRPEYPINDMRPGMSVLVHLPEVTR